MMINSIPKSESNKKNKTADGDEYEEITDFAEIM